MPAKPVDSRSRIYNNEMGYFFKSTELQNQLDETFQSLKEQPYL